MATLLGAKRVGDVTIRATKNGPVLEQTWHYLVEADGTEASRIELAEAVGLSVGVSVVDGVAVLRSLRGSNREGSIYLWDFIGDYSSEVEENANGSNGDPTSDPLTWVPIYRTRFERIESVLTKDSSGTAIANSAGQPFEEGIVRARKLPVWEFYQFDAASVTDEQVIELSETINSTTFRGRAAKTLKLDILSSEVGYYYGQRRRLTHYSLTYDKLKWTEKRQDVGTVYLDGFNLEPYKDNDGNIILGALDGSGAKTQFPNTEPAILEFDVFDEIDFNQYLRV